MWGNLKPGDLVDAFHTCATFFIAYKIHLANPLWEQFSLRGKQDDALSGGLQISWQGNFFRLSVATLLASLFIDTDVYFLLIHSQCVNGVNFVQH